MRNIGSVYAATAFLAAGGLDVSQVAAQAAAPSPGTHVAIQLPTFLAWLGAGALAAYWFTERNPIRVLIALGIALLATGLSSYFGLAAYWWVGALIALALVIRWRRPLFASCRVAWKLMNDYDTYKDRLGVFMSDENWGGELQALRKNVRSYRNIMATLARSPRNYKVFDVIRTQIGDDGTSVMTRTTEVEAKSETVSWIYMMHGTTAASAEGARLELPVITDGSGDRLEFDFIENMDTQKRVIVFLNRPAVVGGGKEQVRTVVTRIKSWHRLIDELRDTGSYSVSHETESVQLTLVVPASLRIERFTVTPSIGKVDIAANGFEVVWSALGLHPGRTYEFEVRCLSRGR